MYKKKNNISKGIVALLISQILIKIIGLAYKLYLTNKHGFGDTGNAIYSSGFQIYALLLTFSSTGVPNAISKLVSERLALGDTKGAHIIFKIAFLVFAFIGLIGSLCLFYTSEFIAKDLIQIPEARYSIMALAPSIFFVSIISVIRGYFNGREDLSVTAKSQTIEQILKTVLTILLVECVSKIIGNDVVVMAASANLATTIATLLSFVYVIGYYYSKRKSIGQEVKQSINGKKERIIINLKRIICVAIPISLTSLMSSFNKNIDSFTIVRFLKRFMTEAQSKVQYGILSGKIDILTILPLCLNIPFVTALVPQISKERAKNNKKEIKRKSEIFILISIIMGLPTTLGMFVFAEPILNLLFPKASSGVLLLKINSLSIIFMFLAQTINGVLQGIGKESIPMISFGVGMIVKLICNVVLIRINYIGIYGAAIGNILCNIVVFIIGYIKLKKYIDIKMSFNTFVFKPFILTFLMILISYYIYIKLKCIILYKMATILAILIAIIVYLIGLFLIKMLPKYILFTKK